MEHNSFPFEVICEKMGLQASLHYFESYFKNKNRLANIHGKIFHPNILALHAVNLNENQLPKAGECFLNQTCQTTVLWVKIVSLVHRPNLY